MQLVLEEMILAGILQPILVKKKTGTTFIWDLIHRFWNHFCNLA